VSLLAKVLKVGLATEPLEPGDAVAVELVRVDARTRQLFGRALAIREVDAGSCNGSRPAVVPGPLQARWPTTSIVTAVATATVR
jgi:hypothetical protein